MERKLRIIAMDCSDESCLRTILAIPQRSSVLSQIIMETQSSWKAKTVCIWETGKSGNSKASPFFINLSSAAARSHKTALCIFQKSRSSTVNGSFSGTRMPRVWSIRSTQSFPLRHKWFSSSKALIDWCGNVFVILFLQLGYIAIVPKG